MTINLEGSGLTPEMAEELFSVPVTEPVDFQSAWRHLLGIALDAFEEEAVAKFIEGNADLRTAAWRLAAASGDLRQAVTVCVKPFPTAGKAYEGIYQLLAAIGFEAFKGGLMMCEEHGLDGESCVLSTCRGTDLFTSRTEAAKAAGACGRLGDHTTAAVMTEVARECEPGHDMGAVTVEAQRALWLHLATTVGVPDLGCLISDAWISSRYL